jgi:hypothetical protein
MLRIVARGMAWGLMPGIFFLPAIPFLSIVPTHDVVVASLLWAVCAAPFLARAVYLGRRAWRLLEETPEPLLMTVKREDDPESDQRVAVFSSPSDPAGRAEVKIGMIYAPDWALGWQSGTQVLVYGARGTGPFVVGMPGWPSLAFLAPFSGVRMPVPAREP